jgi:hypothetical protein
MAAKKQTAKSKSKRKVTVRNLSPKTNKNLLGGATHAGEIEVLSKKRS